VTADVIMLETKQISADADKPSPLHNALSTIALYTHLDAECDKQATNRRLSATVDATWPRPPSSPVRLRVVNKGQQLSLV